MKITRNQVILICIIILIIIITAVCVSKTYNEIILVLGILALAVMILNLYVERKK
ncbi:MAG: hypothetical protein MJ224_00860 [archaeon]|nr:hypothetical protein [archaeon]